jgi:hypothetical protein
MSIGSNLTISPLHSILRLRRASPSRASRPSMSQRSRASRGPIERPTSSASGAPPMISRSSQPNGCVQASHTAAVVRSPFCLLIQNASGNVREDRSSQPFCPASLSGRWVDSGQENQASRGPSGVRQARWPEEEPYRYGHQIPTVAPQRRSRFGIAETSALRVWMLLCTCATRCCDQLVKLRA